MNRLTQISRLEDRWMPLVLIILVLSFNSVSAQDVSRASVDIILETQMEGGKNGAAVVFNPKKKLYYTVMAGNKEYHMETFNEKGENLHQVDAGEDWRGMWWNSSEKSLEGNCYDNGGIVKMWLSQNGYPQGYTPKVFYGGNYQPEVHSCGTFDSKQNEILYYHDGSVVGYDRENGNRTQTNIKLLFPVSKENINSYSLIFTGEKGKELGVLNYVTKEIYLFNRKKGQLKHVIKLPEDIPTESFFNFSYANKHVFLFDIEKRAWLGLKVF